VEAKVVLNISCGKKDLLNIQSDYAKRKKIRQFLGSGMQ
jgi:hypothetical protein